MSNEFEIEDIKLKPGIIAAREKLRRDSVFKRYADAYAAVYVKRPTHYVVNVASYLSIYIDKRMIVSASEKRIKQLTRMLVDQKANAT